MAEIPLENGLTIQLLKILDRKEMKALSKWLHSPWCNSTRQLIALFQILQRYSPTFSSPELTKVRIFAELYPGKEYNDKVCRNLLGKLSGQIREFLVMQQLRGNEQAFRQALIKEYLERGKSEWFIKESETRLRQFGLGVSSSWEDRLEHLLLNEGLYFSLLTTFRQKKANGPLSRADSALESFYLLGKLRFLNEALERQKKFGHEDSALDFDFKAFSRQHNIEERAAEDPLVDIYYHRFLNKDLPLRMQFDSLDGDLRKYVDSLPHKDQRNLFLYLLNDAARLSQTGDTEILSKTLELYKFGIDKELLLEQKRITESTFLNIVSLAAGLGDFEFLDRFMDTHLCKLPSSSVTDARVWAEAKIAYENHDIEKCITELKDYTFQGFVFTYRGRFLLLQAYFEQFLLDDSYFPFFNSFCRRMESNMRNEKRLSKKRRIAVIKFTQYIRKIARWKDGIRGPMEKLDRIAVSLEEERNIQGKYWLQAKIAQLKEER